MIPQIKEINFPEYATLSTATATHVDMGDKTITAQVKIDGSIVPDFSYDWEIEFQGERYIQPLREPQASKGNESISSLIDLTFYHKGIYDLKRYFFVDLATTNSGTAMVDKYIAPLSLNLGEFITALNNVLRFYYGDVYSVQLNPNFEYDETDKKMIDINYTHIWDMMTQIYELFGVRWTWDTSDLNDYQQYYTIKVGYEAHEMTHVFKYGFDGGLLRFERQVQNPEIRNRMFGRGGSQNLPYRYFKKQDPNNTAWKADPDWIPELENVYFANLRGKTFRDYVKGWKAKHYGGDALIPPTDAYKKGFTDDIFSPIEYVEDTNSIAKYGILQGGLDNNEEIFPTIQKRVIDGFGRADEVLAVEKILVDEPTSNMEAATDVVPISEEDARLYNNELNHDSLSITSRTSDIYLSKDAHILKDIDVSVTQYVRVARYVQQYFDGEWKDFTTSRPEFDEVVPLQIDSIETSIIDSETGHNVSDIGNIPKGTTIHIASKIGASGLLCTSYEEFSLSPDGPRYRNVTEVKGSSRIVVSFNTEIDYTPIYGDIIGNYAEGTDRISGEVYLISGDDRAITLRSNEFTVEEDGATIGNVPIRIKPSTDTTGSYTYAIAIDIIDATTNDIATNEDGSIVNANNIPKGTYFLRVITTITNLLSTSETYTVELMPAYIYYPYDADKWRPTFNIWIKDIWGIKRFNNENDLSYTERVWNPILGDHMGNEAKVVFSSGWLSGHSDYEFPIISVAFDDTEQLRGVKSHWRLTLGKSNADVEATGKWLPSIQIQASAGDFFYFIGIDMPHQYVLWAEEEVDKWKQENMPSQFKPSFVIHTDKVRLNSLQESETRPLLNSLRVGNKIRTADFRFIESEYETLHLQSITYTWDASTIMFPNVEVVLSEHVLKTTNVVTQILESNIKLNTKINAVNKVFNTLNYKTNKLGIETKAFSSQVASIDTKATEAKTLSTEASKKASESLTEVTTQKDKVDTLGTSLTKLIDTDKNKSVREIATEVVVDNMPTEVATATQKVQLTSAPSLNSYTANRVYEWKVSIITLTISTLYAPNSSYDNVWVIRFGCQAGVMLNITPSVYWKDGVAPSFGTWGICELIFKKDSSTGVYLGEWKIYK